MFAPSVGAATAAVDEKQRIGLQFGGAIGIIANVMVKRDIERKPNNTKVSIVALPGTPLSSIAVPLDVFSSAATMCKRIFDTADESPFEVRVVSADGAPVEIMGGITVGGTHDLEALDRSDLIVVTALIDNSKSRAVLPTVVDRLRAAHENGSRIAGLCTGAFVLAATGLLDGKAATTHWGACRRFNTLFPKIRLLPHRLVVDEAPIYTSGGSHGASDLCFYLVEHLVGKEIALQWSRVLVKDFRTAVQSPYAVYVGNRRHADAAVISVQDFLEEHYDKPLSVSDLAKRAGLGKRTFERRFKAATDDSPLVYLQRLRVEAAKRMLEMDNLSVAEMTYRVGYEDPSAFSRLFQKVVGIPPAAYRRKFAPGVAPVPET